MPDRLRVRRFRALTVCPWILLAPVAAGCRQAQPSDGYRTALIASIGNPNTAREANERGVTLAVANDYERAERAFREALAADVTCAAAHNNLGCILLERGQLYESALEFSFAGGLDGAAPEPVINLGRLYERVGWHAAAIEQYERALQLEPDSVEALGRLAHACMRAGKNEEIVQPLLRALARKKESSAWQKWAAAAMEPRGDETSGSTGQ